MGIVVFTLLFTLLSTLTSYAAWREEFYFDRSMSL